MKLIIFGATGMVGKQLVRQAIYMGYEVKAFGRNVFTEDLPENELLTLVQGALFDENQVFDAIKDCDVVLSAIGGSFEGNDFTRSLGMKNIVKQMKKASVKRIIAVGGLGVLNADDEKMIIDTDDYPPEYLPVGMEHVKAFEHLKDSGLDWTFVCPPDIKNEDVTGAFITNANFPPEPNQFYINAGDLALFMLSEIQKNEFIRQRVGISN